VALIAVLVLGGLTASMLTFSSAFQRENHSKEQSTKALYVAEAGMSLAIDSVRGGAMEPIATSLDIVQGDSNAPMAFSGGGYWYQIVNNHDNSLTVTSYARVGTESRGTEAILTTESENIYDSALFAGNSSRDPLYDMKFGGTGTQADNITGNIYSGGNVVINGSAALNGDIKASGTITGGSGSTGQTLPIPDIAGMDYAHNNDYDVAALFAGASYASNGLGGSAWQLPEANPAHIFRKNPSDRATNTSSTAKDDYFLEDPFEAVNSSSNVNPSSGTHITLSGQDGNPGVSGTNKVYYIDGNLWIHNSKIFSFTLYNSGAEAIRITLVVKGNIYISDNIMYQGTHDDGLAMIAIKDLNEPNSGNIYFGDPTFGTLERMDAFMYAENDFLDNNLSATGSAKVTVNGNMTAGNQVKINRDWGTQHSKLTVNFDNRISTGSISLPGLPGQGSGGASWLVSSWREVPVPTE